MLRPDRATLTTTVILALVLLGSSNAGAQATTTVRLTSPLGRTAASGTIRVVAQVVTPAPGGVVPVRFYVDGKLLGEDVDGPPYVTEWVDENPYRAREIRVGVEDGAGGVVEDKVALSPLDVTEESYVASVLVEASVVDKAGRAIATLGKSDFSVLEDDVAQSLDLVQVQSMPTQFTLLVDGSQSMARRIDLVKATAKRLTTRLRAGDMVVVAPFRRTVEALTGPTNDANTIAEAITGIQARGGTAIMDSIAQLPEIFASTEGRHVIVLVTDGYDEHSGTPLETAIRAVQRLQATVYVIGIGGVAGISLKGETLLRRIATQTGGRAFFPTREEQLPDVHEKIASDVYSRYLLTYTPTNQEPDGTYRKIHVATAEPTHTIKARPGYYAPKPPPVRPTLEFSARSDVAADVALSAADLTIVEDGVTQTIESFQEANAPMSIIMALDASGSIKPALEAVKDAARTFVNALRPADPLALVQFSDDVVFAHDLSTERQRSLDAINTHPATGGTALWDALYNSMAFLTRQQEGRRAVVVVTDGRDENNPGTGPGSIHTLADVLSQVKNTDTTVYAIGLGAKVDRAALQQVTEASGGAAYFPDDVSLMPEQYRRVLEDLRRRYLVTYTSTNSKRDGAWRSVDITTAKAGVIIRSRRGYAGPGTTAASSPAQR